MAAPIEVALLLAYGEENKRVAMFAEVHGQWTAVMSEVQPQAWPL